jgi:hypothetical protein
MTGKQVAAMQHAPDTRVMDSLFQAHAGLLFGAALALVGILSSLAASRFGVPLLLVFLVVGMLAGEDGPGGFAFSNFKLTYMVGSAALAIILFDGGLRTRLSTVRAVIGPAGVLASVGTLITATSNPARSPVSVVGRYPAASAACSSASLTSPT